MACRNEPAPLLLTLVTVKTAAEAMEPAKIVPARTKVNIFFTGISFDDFGRV
jgi:hypothetical protein